MTITPRPKTPAKPARTKSSSVLVAMWLFVFALGGGIAAISTPLVAPLAVVIGLVAVGVCVLSLREDL